MDRISAEQLPEVIALATRAPSIHNTQPWRFAAADGVIDVYADRGRKLPVMDPTGRQLLISCGGAVCYARLGVRAAGYAVRVELLPTPADPDHLARLTVGDPLSTTDDERALLAAIPHRHTNRLPFEDREVPTALIAELEHRASLEGAWLRLIEQSSAQMTTVVLLSNAERRSCCATSTCAVRARCPFTVSRWSGLWSSCWAPTVTGRPTGCAPSPRSCTCCCGPPSTGSPPRR